MSMKTAYYVTDVTFDFTDSQGEITPEHQACINYDTVGIWYAYDEEHLIDTISDTTGWCISDISFTTDLSELK